MATARVMATALPFSLADEVPHHLTAFVTLKLDPADAGVGPGADSELAAFPAAADWVGTLQAGRWELVTDASADPFPLTVVEPGDPAAAADTEAWAAVLPQATPVAGFPAPTVSQADWSSYPAHRLGDRALDLHLATVAAAPTTRPGVLTNPAVSGVLDRMAQTSDTIPLLRRLAEVRGQRAVALRDRRLREAYTSIGMRVGRLEGGYASTVTDETSALEVLLRDTDLDARVTSLLDGLAASDQSADPVAGTMADAHATRRYYERPEEQTEYRPRPEPGVTTPRPTTTVPDFHARVASMGSTPALLRRLGLAVDLRLADADRALLAGATWVAVRFVPAPDAEVTRVAPPRTLVSVAGDHFDAVSSDEWVAGALPLADPGYVLLDLDPDASGLKLDQHLRGLPRAAATEVNGDPASSAPGTLRTAGFAVARSDRVAATRTRTVKAESMSAPDDGPDVLGPEMTYDDLVRGLRLEVWDDRSGAWHSLHERLVTVVADPGDGQPQPVLTEAADMGFLQLSGLNRVPGSPANPYYLHEVVAGWDGWSLSAPRPGLTIVHGPGGEEQVVREPADPPVTGVQIRTRVRPGSLPRLRWGTSYSFRLVGVDLAGGTVVRPADPGPGEPPSPDAVAAAAAHLQDLAQVYAARDRGSLLTAVRGAVLDALPTDDGPPLADVADGAAGAESDVFAWDAGEPAPEPRTPDWLVTGDDLVDGHLAALWAQAALDVPAPSDAQVALAQVAQANATLLRAYDSWRVRPQLQADPALFARAAGGPGAPDAPEARVVTAPRPYLRWAPVPPPPLVARTLLSTGEQLSRLVVRSGVDAGSPDAVSESARHVVPPKTTQLDAETDGRFDLAIGSTDAEQQRVAYAVALAERGTLLDELIPSLDDATATRTQPGMMLASRPGADPGTAVTLQNITDVRDTPLGEGQYVVHATDDLVLPYLPDPHAAGVALVFYDAGAPHTLAEPRVLQAVVLPFPGDWPRVEPLRLVLRTGATLGAGLDGRAVVVTVPPGEQVRVAMSSSLRSEDLTRFGLWRSHLASVAPGDGAGGLPQDQLIALVVLMRAAAAGWLWWLTPSVDLRLVHATPGPARVPELLSLACLPRARGLTVAVLTGLADLHGASTDRLVVTAAWREWVDDVATPAPVQVDRQAVVVSSTVGGSERVGLLWLIDLQPFGDDPTMTALADAGVGLHRSIATFPDTHRRRLTCTPSGVTRYAELFAAADLPAPQSAAVSGAPVEVEVPSAERPAAPDLVDAVPLIRWEESTEPDQPFAVRRVRRSGVRIWMRRPWYSSGDGELLGVVLAGPAGGPDASVSLWGRDPVYTGPTIGSATTPPLLEPGLLLVEAVAQTVVPRPGRPVAPVATVPLADVADTPDARVLGYQPEYHPDRGQWFVDVAMDDGPDLWPFVRLAVARYQPSAITGCSLSAVGLTSWVQPLPTRTVTVSRPDAGHVRVTLTGVVALLRAPRRGDGAGGVEEIPGEELDADSPTGLLLRLDDVVGRTRVVTASLQQLPDGGSDLQWATVATKRLRVVGRGAPDTLRVTWSGELALPGPVDLQTPGRSTSWRVVVEEQELLDADAPGVSNDQGQTVTVARTVYADTIAL